MVSQKKPEALRLMALEAEWVAGITELLRQSALDVEARIRAAGDATNPLTMMQLKAQREAIYAYLGQKWNNIESAISLGQKAAAREASAVVSEYEDELLKLVFTQQMMDQIATSEANRAAAGVNAALRRMQGASYNLKEQVYQTRKVADGYIDTIVNKALIQGWTASQLAAAVKSSINPNTPGGVSYAANRLARSEINNAFHAASVQRYKDSKVADGVDWNLSTSHPENDICDVLAEESPYDLEQVPKKPHPFCYCFLTPHLPTEDEFMKNLLDGKYDDGAWGGAVIFAR